MKLYQGSPIFPESMPLEERIAILQDVAQAAEDEFQRNYFSLREWFEEYDALHLLAYCCCYFLCHPAGVDPEVGVRLEFYPHHLEILQAFSLMQERTFSDRPLGPDAEKLLDVMSAIGQAESIRGFNANFDQAKVKVSVISSCQVCVPRQGRFATRAIHSIFTKSRVIWQKRSEKISPASMVLIRSGVNGGAMMCLSHKSA